MEDLLAFLRAQLDEDGRVALAAIGNSCSRGDWLVERPGFGAAIRTDDGDVVIYDEGAPSEEQIAHIARWDPARVLAKVKADRQLVTFFARIPEMSYDAAQDGLLLLAQPYADRPGWREEWSIES